MTTSAIFSLSFPVPSVTDLYDIIAGLPVLGSYIKEKDKLDIMSLRASACALLSLIDVSV